MCEKCVSSGLILWKHENTTDQKQILGLYGDYNDNGYVIYLHPNDLNRTDFNVFLGGIRDHTINDAGCKVIIIDMNVYHCQNKAIIKVTIIFEFSIIGDNNMIFKTQVRYC